MRLNKTRGMPRRPLTSVLEGFPGACHGCSMLPRVFSGLVVTQYTILNYKPMTRPGVEPQLGTQMGVPVGEQIRSLIERLAG
jgi:hypothetical protein